MISAMRTPAAAAATVMPPPSITGSLQIALHSMKARSAAPAAAAAPNPPSERRDPARRPHEAKTPTTHPMSSSSNRVSSPKNIRKTDECALTRTTFRTNEAEIPRTRSDRIKPRTPSPSKEQQEAERPDQVELLLNGQRPRVAEYPQGLAAHHDPVGHVEERGDGRVGHPKHDRHEHLGRPVQARDDHHRDIARDDQHDEGGQEPKGAPGVEFPQADAPGARPLIHQQRRDQEAAEDEEDVDAEEAAPDEADVVRHDGEDRHPAQSVQWRPITEREWRYGRRRLRGSLGATGGRQTFDPSTAAPRARPHPPPSARRRASEAKFEGALPPP